MVLTVPTNRRRKMKSNLKQIWNTYHRIWFNYLLYVRKEDDRFDIILKNIVKMPVNILLNQLRNIIYSEKISQNSSSLPRHSIVFLSCVRCFLFHNWMVFEYDNKRQISMTMFMLFNPDQKILYSLKFKLHVLHVSVSIEWHFCQSLTFSMLGKWNLN